MPSLTIAGHSFTLDTPFEAGHVLNEAEASVLNQTWLENIRNNTAKHVKKAVEDGEDPTKIVEDYASSYQFGVRVAGTGAVRTADPVEREALKIAKAEVKAALAKKKLTAPKEKVLELAHGFLEKYPSIREKAAEIVAARKSVAGDITLDDLEEAA